MVAAMDADDSVLLADAVVEVGLLEIDCNPDMDTDVRVLSLVGDSPSVVAASSALDTVAHQDQQQVLEEKRYQAPTKLSFRNKMEIFCDLAEAYEGHVDEMELYGAMIAQTRLLQGKGDSTIGSLEHLSNYLLGVGSGGVQIIPK
jgi:hypothetical protein